MKKCLLLVLAILGLVAPAFAQTTWYVRPDGGTRYSANQTNGQCDGEADAPYTGSGVNQHCAFNDYRYLWDDRTYGNHAWVIAGGDTVIIRGGPWRVGFDQGVSPNDVWCAGGDGNNACINPKIPAGTPTQHTRILGENYASCGTSTKTDRTKLTQIFGGYGAWVTLNLDGAQFVDVGCLEVTSHSACVVHGDPVFPKGCKTSYPVDDYDSTGIVTDTGTYDVLLQDIWDHGHTDRGIKGPIGGTITAERVDVETNGSAGWDFDDGTGSNNGNGTASINGVWNFWDSSIAWSGCNQSYPFTGPASCYSQHSGGYGDGVGTPPGTCLATNVKRSSFHHNTQDGLDLGHADTGSCPLSISDSIAYANGGGTFKWGPNEKPAVLNNNVIIANGFRMSQPIDGIPDAYNQFLGDFDRANDAVSFNFRDGGTATITNNTLISYFPTSFDVQCWDAACLHSSLTLQGNIILGYDNPTTYNSGGQSGGIGTLFLEEALGTVIQGNNTWFRTREYQCLLTEICADPQFVGEPTGNASTFVESELDLPFYLTKAAGSPSASQGADPTNIPLPVSYSASTGGGGTGTGGGGTGTGGGGTTTPPTTAGPEIANAIFIASEGITITQVSDPAAVLQFGSGTSWCPTTIPGSTPMPLYISYSNPVICQIDHAPGATKMVVAQRKANDYTVTWTDGSTSVTTLVPALPAPPPPPPPPHHRPHHHLSLKPAP